MLAPLTQIADAARMAANGSLSHRIRMAGPEDEFRELADVFDTMLEQLESHVTEQRRFAANASHELRTPLAISQTLLDVARKDPGRDQGELIERLHTVNTRAIDLTEALLLLSRSDRRVFTREPVDLSLIAEEATETLLPLAEQRQITLEVTGGTTKAVGSAALLLRMVTNLVQNAVVHNLPTGGTVTIHTESRHDASVLRVENTGHPLPPELVPTLTEPFQRGTERRRTDEHAGCRPRAGHRAQHRPSARRDPRPHTPSHRRSPRHHSPSRHAADIVPEPGPLSSVGVDFFRDSLTPGIPGIACIAGVSKIAYATATLFGLEWRHGRQK